MKEVKVYWFVIVCFMCLFCAEADGSLDLAMTIRKVENDYILLRCIANGNALNSALTWISPIKENFPETYANYSKVIENFDEPSKNWTANSWFKGISNHFSLGAILDQRWEKFTLLTVNGQLKMRNVDSTKSLTLSIRMENDSTTEIFLIDEVNLLTYKMEITKNSIIIKFDNAEKKRINVDLNQTVWLHVTISWKDNDKILITIGNDSYEFSIKSHFQPIFWELKSNKQVQLKVHEYNFLWTDKMISLQQFGPTISQNSFTSLSIFILLCKRCQMRLTLSSSDTNESNETITVNGTDYFNQWHEIHFPIKNIDKFNLLVATFCIDSEDCNGFWAIDDVTLTYDDELRASSKIIKESEILNWGCQSLRHPKIPLMPKLEVSNANSCPTSNNIFRRCITGCETIFSMNASICRAHKTCILDNSGNSKCYCASGYKGSFCDEECTHGWWGGNCKKKCGNCADNFHCNKITGECENGCASEHIGKKCERNWPMLNYPPKVVKNGTTFFIIEFINNTYLGQNPKTVKIEYREKEESEWILATEFNYSDYPDAIIINELEVATTYQIRAILCVGNENCYSERDVPITEALTNCNDLLDDFEIETTNTTATLKLNRLMTTEDCRLEFYEANVHGILVKNIAQIIPNLLPHKTHQIILRNTFLKTNKTIKFRTKLGIPSVISDLTAYSKDENYISLRWKPPYPPNGELESYYISYSMDASFQERKPMKCELWDDYHCAELENLKKDTDYSIEIRVKNKDVEVLGAKSESIVVKTRQEKSQAPKILSAHFISNEQLYIKWAHPYITNGRLKNFEIKIDVLESENQSKPKPLLTIPVKESMKIYDCVIEDLEPSTWYNISIRGINEYQGELSSINVFTKPPKPNFVSPPYISQCFERECQISIPKGKDFSKQSEFYIIAMDVTVTENEESSVTEHIRNLRNGKSGYNMSSFFIVKNGSVDASFFEKSLNVSFVDLNNMIGDKAKIEVWNSIYYKILIVLQNTYRGRHQFTEYILKQSSVEFPRKILLWLLLLIIPIGLVVLFIIYRKRNNSEQIAISVTNDEENKNSYEDSVSLLSENNTFNNDHQQIPISIINDEENKNGYENLVSMLSENNKFNNDHQQIAISVTNDEQNENSYQYSAPMLLKNNMFSNDHLIEFSRPIHISSFEEYVKSSLICGNEINELYKQHRSLPKGMMKTHECGMKPANKTKNRYINITPYDYNRVVLEKNYGDEDSDYINASYIDSFDTRRAYIATQDPKIATVDDFWRMIWQENVNTIIMVTNLAENNKNKSAEYWPTIVNNNKTFGIIKVINEKLEISSEYEFTTLKIRKNDEERMINHLHFSAWLDHDISPYVQSLIQFVKKIQTIPYGSVPIVVHSSAGVGRIGTVILCDMALRMAAKNFVDMWKLCKLLRDQRANMVDSEEQYKLAHLVVLECMLGMDTSIPCDCNFPETIEKYISNIRIKFEMNYLERIAWLDQIMKSDYTIYNGNNGFRNVLLDSDGYTTLDYRPINDEHFRDINAVYVDGFHDPKRFIATKQPLPSTLGNFWRFVIENGVKVIISLNKASCFFWPLEDEEIQPVPFITIKCLSIENVEDIYEIINLLLTDSRREEENNLNVTIINMKKWLPNKQTPEISPELLMVWKEASELMKANRPVIVSCYDGVTASGLFLALTYLIEKINIDKECNVCLAVRNVRLNQQMFVRTKDQFEFLYWAALEYLSGSHTYSNFRELRE